MIYFHLFIFVNILLESTVVDTDQAIVKDRIEHDSFLEEPSSSSTPKKCNPPMVETCKFNKK